MKLLKGKYMALPPLGWIEGCTESRHADVMEGLLNVQI